MREADLASMLQSLLASEFKLIIHRQLIPRDAFVLVLAKGGPKLQTASGQGPPNCTLTFNDGQFNHVCTGFRMPDLAERLPRMAPADIDRPVVDLTELSGTYDFTLNWSGRTEADATGSLTIFSAIGQL